LTLVELRWFTSGPTDHRPWQRLLDALYTGYGRDLGPDWTHWIGLRIALHLHDFSAYVGWSAGEVERYAALGAEIVDVSLPHASYGLPAYYLIAPSECSSNLSRYDGVRYGLRVDGPNAEDMMARTRDAGFGAEVKRRIMIGTYALSAGYYDAYYAQAQRVRTLIIRDFERAYDSCDVLVSATSPTAAFRIGERADDPLAMYLSDVYTIPANLAGAPALSLPVGLDDDGLPVGLQVMAPVLGESLAFQVARALEAEVGFDATPTALEEAAA
jgi:aspartyl-tRNA(Asn)/glutamyl-tRNA(Gln) amidotransferase subunit A